MLKEWKILKIEKWKNKKPGIWKIKIFGWRFDSNLLNIRTFSILMWIALIAFPQVVTSITFNNKCFDTLIITFMGFKLKILKK